ncbi:MAG: SDR family oxidoreductase [Marinobacter sp.]|nr:SDR family oxidoreductase [Marinobacter sp.]
MATLIAGISGAIGGALAERHLQDPKAVVVGLCRAPEQVPDKLRDHSRVHLFPWTAGEEGFSPGDHFAEVIMANGGLDTLIYAAGLLHDDAQFPEKRLEDVQAEAMTRAFQVNSLGFALLVRELMPWLRGRHLKRVAAVSAKVGSISDNHLGGWYAYRCSKAALNMTVKNLSVELPRRFSPIACVALHPGTTRSELSEPFSQSLARLTVHEPEDTAENLYTVLSGLTEADNGRFINWDGSDLPW